MAKIKLPKRAPSAAVKKRARRMGRRRARADFGRRLMNAFNLGNVHSEMQDRSLRDWRRSVYAGALKKQLQANVIDVPPLGTPTKENDLSNPDISALSGQLKQLLKTAKAMGIVDKETQDLTVKQIRAANNAAKEQQLENPTGVDAVPEQQEGAGGGIEPLADKMNDLIKAFEDLIDTVEDKNKEQGGNKSLLDRLAEGFGLGDVREEYKKKPARLRKGYTAERTKSGGVRYRDASGRYTTPEKALKRGYAKNQIVSEARAARAAKAGGTAATGIMGRLGGAARAVASPFVRAGRAIAGTSLVGSAGRATNRIATGIKVGARSAKGAAVGAAGLTGRALTSAITKVAGPKIAKALATTGVKSIPILGTVAGLGFAASRLVQGDWLGAGLDAVSGLAGPVTAIPAMVLSLSRDIYSDVFGVQPESDPMVGERMTLVKSTVQGMVEQQLGRKAKPKTAMAPGQAPGGKAPPVPTAVKQSAPAVASSAPPPPPPTPAPQTATTPADTTQANTTAPATKGPSGGGSAPMAEPSQGGTPSAGSTDMPSQQATPEAPTAKAPEAGSQGSVAALSMPPLTTTGSQIVAASEAAEVAGTPKPRIGRNTVAIRPARTPTTRTGARGMGNVPDPSYAIGAIASQLYFSASI